MKSSIKILNIQSKHKPTSNPAIKSIQGKIPRLLIATSEGIHVIPHKEILCFKAEGNYCKIFLLNGKKILASKTLKFLQAQVPSQLFLRVHQSYLINLLEIRFIAHDHLILSSEKSVPVSRSKKSILQEAIHTVS